MAYMQKRSPCHQDRGWGSGSAGAVVPPGRAVHGQHTMHGRTAVQGGQGWRAQSQQGSPNGRMQPGQGPPSAASTGTSLLASWGRARAFRTGIAIEHWHGVHAPKEGQEQRGQSARRGGLACWRQPVQGSLAGRAQPAQGRPSAMSTGILLQANVTEKQGSAERKQPG